MNLVRPIEIAPGLYQLPALGAKVTALFVDDGVVLVDAGWRGSTGLVATGLKALGSSLDRVRLIVVTHYHPDHAGALGSLVDRTAAKVAAHIEEVGVISGSEPFPSPFSNRLLAAFTRPLLPFFCDHPVTVAFPLKDADALPLAPTVKVIHTPGHTQGSICLYETSTKVLIVGDALQYRFRRLSPPASWVSWDLGLARQSLKKLLALDFEVICFSHFPPLRHGAREALSQLIQRMEAKHGRSTGEGS